MNKNKKISLFSLAGLTILSTVIFLSSGGLALADRGNGRGGDDNRSSRSGQATLNVDNSGPGNNNNDRNDEDVARIDNSGPGSANSGRDDDDNDRRGENRAFVSNSNSGGNNEDDDNDRRRGRGLDDERIRISANGNVELRGATITSVSSGSTFQVMVLNRAFTVNTGNARLLDRDNAPISFAIFAVGDQVRVKGVLSLSNSTSNITASKIVNRSIEIEDCFRNDDIDLDDDDDDSFFRLFRNDNNNNDNDRCRVATTTPDTVAPVLSAIAAVPGTTSASITWTTNEPSTSIVFFGTTTPLNISASTTQSVSNSSLVTGHSILISGLNPNTVYRYIVRSTDAAGNTATSGEFSFTTQTVAVTAPVISGITATPGITSAAISWLTDIPATGRVLFGTASPFDPNATTTLSIFDPALLTGHSFTLTGLTASTTYFYAVQSGNSVGTTTLGIFSFLTVADTTPPVLSSVFAVATSPTTAAVTWTTNEPSTSRVFFGTTTPVNLLTAPSVSSQALVTDHSVNLSGLTASTTFFAIAESTDASGNTATSSQVSFTTPSATQ